MTIFGANWRTSVSGYIETACLVIIALCALPTEYWANPRVWIPAVALIISKTIKDTLTKDKNVVGGSVQQDVSGATVPPNKASLVRQTISDTPPESR